MSLIQFFFLFSEVFTFFRTQTDFLKTEMNVLNGQVILFIHVIMLNCILVKMTIGFDWVYTMLKNERLEKIHILFWNMFKIALTRPLGPLIIHVHLALLL